MALAAYGLLEPQDTPQHTDSDAELAAVLAATSTPINPELAAEAFALNCTSTDLQRDELKQVLISGVVEWDLPIYEIKLEEGAYRITSQPFVI